MKVLIYFILASLFLLSCNKDQLSTQVIYKENNQNILNEIDLGFQNFQEGNLHNQLCKIIIDNWSICSRDTANVNAEIKKILSSNCVSFVQTQSWNYTEFLNVVSKINWAKQNQTIQLNEIDNYSFIDSLNVSSLLKSKIHGFAGLLDTILCEQPVINLKNTVNNYYYSNLNELNQNEIILFGSMIDVALSSIDFWSDSSIGGENMIRYFKTRIDQICPPIINNRWGGIKWGKVFLSDAAGIIGGATRAVVASGGAAALPNPAFGGIPSAGIAGLVGGATSSCVSVINQWE